MSNLSIGHFIGFTLMLAMFGIPAALILKRMGLSRWWVILAMLPYVNIIGVWILAFARWPALQK